MDTFETPILDAESQPHEVMEYHPVEERVRQPLYLIGIGGAMGMIALVAIVYLAYLISIPATLDQTLGLGYIALLSPFYIGGVFLFCYGYETRNIKRALQLTAIMVLSSFAAVVIFPVAFIILVGESPEEPPPDTSSSQPSISSSSQTTLFSRIAPKTSDAPIVNQPITDTPIEAHGTNRTLFRRIPEVKRSIDCPFCGRTYTTTGKNYICPECGAATPKEVIARAEAPKEK